MKKKNYEQISLLILFIIITYIFFGVFLLSINNIKINTFKVFNGIVLKDDLLQLLVTTKELELFQDNKFIYIDNKKYEFKIREVNRDLVKRKEISYHSILIEWKYNNDLKVNDIVDFSIFYKKISLLEMFKIIWKEDLDGEA